MFNRKLCFLLMFLLFILHISFVNAVECNGTDDIVEIHDEYELSVNNDSCEDNYVYRLSDVEGNFDGDNLDFNQGDKIPITMDSSNVGDGILTVLIDNEMYGSWNFLNSETILIPTYNPDSFWNSSIKNIGVGTHNLSLIFNFITCNFTPVVSKEGSHLNFHFYPSSNDILNKRFSYTYNSILNIYKKEKTIHVSTYNPTYYSLISFDYFMLLEGIDKDDVNSWDDNVYGYGVILSNNEGIIYKDDYSVGWMYHDNPKFDGNGMPYCKDGGWCGDVSGITYDVMSKMSILNLTLISFVDGTSDSVLFNLSKFYPLFNCIDYEVNGNNVTFYYTLAYFPDSFVSVDGVSNFISATSKDEYWNVTFTNLSHGVHIMSLEYPETEFTKHFFYQLTFEINGSNSSNDSSNKLPNKLPNIINIALDNVSFNIFPHMILNNNGIFLYFNLNYGLRYFQEWSIIENLNTKDYEFNSGGVSKVSGESMSVGDDHGGNSFNDGSSNVKSYEISKKSVSKSIDNLLTQFGITFLSCMSFMVGFFIFGKKNKQ